MRYRIHSVSYFLLFISFSNCRILLPGDSFCAVFPLLLAFLRSLSGPMVAFCIALSLPDALQIDNWIVNVAPLRKRANCSHIPMLPADGRSSNFLQNTFLVHLVLVAFSLH
jgi:hypothetical protein